MADVNTEKTKSGFVFGQNMEDRAIKPNDEDVEGSTENGETTGVSSTTGASNLLRPSAFGGGAGATGSTVIAPSRFQSASNNPWQAQTPDSSDSAVSSSENSGGAHQAASHVVSSSNPFAERAPQASVSAPGSDSEAEERKDKPVVAPSHFKASRPICAPPKFAANTPSPSKCLLRPSALDKQTVNLKPASSDSHTPQKSSFKLEPAKLQSPFGLGKAGDSNKENEKSSAASGDVDTTKPGLSEEANKRLSSGEASSAEAAKDTSQSGNAASSESKQSFVFGENLGDRATSVSSSNTSSSAFVFGENLSDRVERAPGSAEETTATENGPTSSDTTTPEKDAVTTQTLAESAAAEQAKMEKPELDEVEVKTGEENESNVFQMNAKLYAFDTTRQNWCEKGRGALRLNDMTTSDTGGFQSRLVMRAQGSLRVILNTKVWAAQTIERANPRSIKISAWDIEENSIKIFLIQANPKDADQIFYAIDWRIQQLKMEETSKQSAAAASQEEDEREKSEHSTRAAVQKRRRDGDNVTPPKKPRVDGEQRKEPHHAEESNDSSAVDPETEASNESFASSPTVKSTSSDN